MCARTKAAFNQIALAYDNSIDWDNRLRQEIPLLIDSLGDASTRRVLDIASGSGRHSVALAELGAQVVAIDASEQMISAARNLAKQRGVSVESLVMRMQNLPQLRPREFDLAVCLGNSLSLLPNVESIVEVMKNTRLLLSDTGRLVLQVLNFEEIRRTGFWSFPPKDGIGPTGEKLIFARFFDHDDREPVSNLILLVLKKSIPRWSAQISSQRVLNLDCALVEDCLARAGFRKYTLFGDFKRSPLDREKDRNIVIVAEAGK